MEKYKPKILSLLTEEILSETVQEYVSDSGKSTIAFESSDDDKSKIKITTKLFVDMDINKMPSDYQTTFMELMEMIELKWNELISQWYSGDLSKASEEVEETNDEIDAAEEEVEETEEEK